MRLESVLLGYIALSINYQFLFYAHLHLVYPHQLSSSGEQKVVAYLDSIKRMTNDQLRPPTMSAATKMESVELTQNRYRPQNQ